jgi:hypothetical protein
MYDLVLVIAVVLALSALGLLAAGHLIYMRLTVFFRQALQGG